MFSYIQNAISQISQSTFRIADGLINQVMKWAMVHDAIETCGAEITNYSSDPKLALAIFSEEMNVILRDSQLKNMGNRKRALYFDYLKHALLRSRQGMSRLNLYQAVNLVKDNIETMNDTIFKMHVLSEIILPLTHPKDPSYKALLGSILNSVLGTLKNNEEDIAVRTLTILASSIPFKAYQNFKNSLSKVIPYEVYIRIEAGMVEQVKILKKERHQSLASHLNQQIRINLCRENRLEVPNDSKPQNRSKNEPWKKVIAIGCIASAMISQVRAATLRDDFKNALMIRNSSIKEGRFVVYDYLATKSLCTPGITPCTLPSELSAFDCTWNLVNIDLSDLKGISCSFIAPFPSICVLTGSKFARSSFTGLQALNADFSDSKMIDSNFDESQIINTTFKNLDGNASFQKISSENSSWEDSWGNLNFFGARIRNGNFRHEIPESQNPIDKRVLIYNFTGSIIDKGQFQTRLTGVKFVNSDRTLIFNTDKDLKGTIFNECTFNLEDYGNVTNFLNSQFLYFFYNLSDTALPSSVFKPPNPIQWYFPGQRISYGGNFKNVSFSENFTFPFEDSYTGCSKFTLSDVSACGQQRLKNFSESYSCLTHQCSSVEVKNTYSSLNEHFQIDLNLPRDPKLLKANRFSVNLFLKDLNLCPQNATLCDLPKELSALDCDWNLQQVDLSNLNANELIIISSHEKCDLKGSYFENSHFENMTSINCDLQGGHFENSHFKNMTSINCDLQGGHFENSHFENMTSINCDLQGGHFENSHFENMISMNANFSESTGSVSFKNAVFKNSTWENFIGNLSFISSELTDVNFQQKLPDNIYFSRKTNYNFMDSKIYRGLFQTIYPKYATLNNQYEASFSLNAESSTNRTNFKECVFGLKTYDTESEWMCSTKINWFFNLNNTIFSDSVINEPEIHRACKYFGREIATYGANLNKVHFSENFTFPANRLMSCNQFILEDVSACGYPGIGIANVPCLIPNCKTTIINNDTRIASRFQAAVLEQNPLYIHDESFDIHKYFWLQGLCDKDNVCEIDYNIFNGTRRHDRLFWGKISTTITNFDPLQKIYFTNNKIQNSQVTFINDFEWNNTEFMNSTIQIQEGTYLFQNTEFNNAQLSTNSIKQALFVNSAHIDISIVPNNSEVTNLFFRSINDLQININEKALSNSKFENINKLKLNFISVCLKAANVSFDNISALSGNWEKGKLIEKSMLVKKTMITNMTFTNTMVCNPNCTSYASKTKTYLKNSGFKLGKNVLFIYDNPDPTPRSIIILKWTGIWVGIIGAVTLSAYTLVRLHRYLYPPPPPPVFQPGP